jgi:hypothetical protein
MIMYPPILNIAIDHGDNEFFKTTAVPIECYRPHHANRRGLGSSYDCRGVYRGKVDATCVQFDSGGGGWRIPPSRGEFLQIHGSYIVH